MTAVDTRPAMPARDPPARPARRANIVERLKKYFRQGLRDWIREFLEYKYLIALSLVLIAVAMYLDYLAGVYVSSTYSIQVPDLILDHVEPVDLDFLFVYGYVALITGLVLYPLFFHIRIFHIAISQLSLLVMLRSLFMIFTHLETPPDSVPVHFPSVFGKLYFENDMFFSGHTAIPFLGFYLFHTSPIRYVFLAGSIVMAITVLVMHLHYSIDVFSAFFITYCSYRIGNVCLRMIDARYHE